MLRSLLFGLGLVLSVVAANANGPMKAMHGGEVQQVGANHVELVVSDGELMLYVSDNQDNPVAVEDVRATATILSGGKHEKVELEPGEGNVLRAKGNFSTGKGLKVVVSLTMPDEKPVLARFAPFD